MPKYRVTLADEPSAVLDHIAEHGPSADIDISIATGIDDIDLSLLVALGLIAPIITGSQPDRWRLTDAGREVVGPSRAQQLGACACGRVLVGQGDDTYDPACALVAGHGGLCSPEDEDATV